MVLVVMSGGCGGGSDSNHASSNVINAPGATLPADPDNWTTEEKAAWVNQGTLLLDRITSEEFEGRMTGGREFCRRELQGVGARTAERQLFPGFLDFLQHACKNLACN